MAVSARNRAGYRPRPVRPECSRPGWRPRGPRLWPRPGPGTCGGSGLTWMTWSSFLMRGDKCSGAVGGHDRPADRPGGVAGKVDEQVGDGLWRDRVGQQVRGCETAGRGGVEQLGGDAVDPDPGRAQLQVEDPDEVDESGLAQGIAGLPGGRLQAGAR